MEHTRREFIGWKYHIKPKYDYTHTFSCGRAYVERNYKVSFIGHSGRVKVSHNRKREFDTSFQEDLLSYATSKGYGFLDRAGKVAIPAIFHHAERFYSNRAVIMDDDEKYGVINRNGDIKVECQYEEINNYSSGLATFKSGKYGYLNHQGKIHIEPAFVEAGNFVEGLAKVLKPGRKHKCFIDTEGEELFKTTKFEFVDDFSEGYAVVKRLEKYGYIDVYGEIIIPSIHIDAKPFRQGLAAVQNSDGLYGYINSHGKLVIPHQFQKAGQFHSGLARVRHEHGWGLINRRGRFVVEPQFMSISRVFNGLVAYCIYGGCGYLKLT